MLLVDYDKCQPALADKRNSNYFKTDRRKKRNLKQIALF